MAAKPGSISILITCEDTLHPFLSLKFIFCIFSLSLSLSLSLCMEKIGLLLTNCMFMEMEITTSNQRPHNFGTTKNLTIKLLSYVVPVFRLHNESY